MSSCQYPLESPKCAAQLIAQAGKHIGKPAVVQHMADSYLCYGLQQADAMLDQAQTQHANNWGSRTGVFVHELKGFVKTQYNTLCPTQAQAPKYEPGKYTSSKMGPPMPPPPPAPTPPPMPSPMMAKPAPMPPHHSGSIKTSALWTTGYHRF